MDKQQLSALLTRIQIEHNLPFRQDAVNYVAELVGRTPKAVKFWLYRSGVPESVAAILVAKLNKEG